MINDLGFTNWPILSPRYFAVSYDNGDDTNQGYSDVDLASAGAVAIKTLTRLGEILPKFGAGRRAVIAIESRAGAAAYLDNLGNPETGLCFLGLTGYEKVTIRGTATDTTAASVAFDDSPGDKILCGGLRDLAPLNGPGYEVTGGSVYVIACTKTGGAAADFTDETDGYSPFIGLRVRFDINTTTPALRNACGMIWKMDSTSQFELATALPDTPVAGDKFYLEAPGVKFEYLGLSGGGGSNESISPALPGSGVYKSQFAIAGIHTTNAVVGMAFTAVGGILTGSFIVSDGAIESARCSDVRLDSAWQDEGGVARSTGVGIKTARFWYHESAMKVVVQHSACQDDTARVSFYNCHNVKCGNGTYIRYGMRVAGDDGSSSSGIGPTNAIIGSHGDAGEQPLRIVGTNDIPGIELFQSPAVIRGVEITYCDTLPCIQVASPGRAVIIDDVTGSVGNNDFGIDLFNCLGTFVSIGRTAAVTVTGNADIRMATPTDPAQDMAYQYADLTGIDLRDALGNIVIGSFGNRVSGREFLQTVTLGSAAAYMEFANLDGDLDGGYEIEWDIVRKASTDIYLKPNNVGTDQATITDYSTNAGAASTIAVTGACLLSFSSGLVGATGNSLGRAYIRGERTGAQRYFEHRFFDEEPGTSFNRGDGEGHWREVATKLTSLRIVPASGAADLDTGSTATLWRVRRR